MTDNKIKKNVSMGDVLGFKMLETIVAIIIIPIAVATLYIWGVSYYVEWFGFWELEPGLFPISNAETMYYGAFALAVFASNELIKFLFIVIAMVVFVIPTYFFLKKYNLVKIEQSKAGVIDKEVNIQGDYEKANAITDRSIIRFVGVIVAGLWFCILLCVYAFLLSGSYVYVEKVGSKQASITKEKYDQMLDEVIHEENTFNKVQTFKLRGKEPVKGIVISCSTSICALYLGEGKRETFNISDIESTVSEFIPGEKND